MKSITALFLVFLFMFCFTTAQSAETVLAEKSPYTSAAVSSPNPTEAPWDLQFSFNLEVASGALGNAGAEFDGTYYYTTRWATNLIHKFDMSGNLVEEFSIPGVTGLRDLAFDGTYMYGGAAANTIYQMDFVTKTLIGTISTPVAVRFIAYDEANDAFWCGNWSDPATLVSRTGTTLGSITTGLLGQYGAAYDGWNTGGPFLYIFDQGSGAGFPQLIYQYDITSGTATGVTHDVAADFPASAGIAGGLWTGVGVVPGLVSIGGCLQGTPDMFFVYELGLYGDDLDPNPPTNFTAFSDETIPNSMLLTWTDPLTYINGNPLTNFTIEIERDGAFLTSVASGTETYTDMGLTQYTEYTYEIYAKDNLDSTSSKVSATWMAGGYPPIMMVQPTSLSDTLLTGGTNIHTITIYNNQSAPGPLNYTITEDPASGWLSVSSTSGTVNPSSSEDVDVYLNAAGLASGSNAADLIIQGNDPMNAADTVSVSLQVYDAPVVTFTPDSMHFTLDPTGVAYPVTDSLVMTITNTGLGPLNFELTDEDIFGDYTKKGIVDRSYLRPDFNVEIPKGETDWRRGSAQTEGAGGPDQFGYTWIDSDEPGGPSFNWIDISATGTEITGLADDNYVGPFPIGFDFQFYGIPYSQFYVQSNGLISFSDSYITLSNYQIPLPDSYNNLIAWLWDDLDPGNTLTHVYYQNMGTMLVIQFEHYFEYPDGGHWVDAEMFLYANGNIKIQYDYFDPGFDVLSCTVGIENADGSDGLQVVYNAPYLHDELALLFSLESQWLSENPTSGTIPPGGSTDIMVKADATGLIGGEYLALLHIISNDPVHPDTTMPVGLTVFGTPQISVDPLSLTFDTLLVGAMQTLPVNVSNTGSFPLNVTVITTTNTDFSVDSTNFTVGVGQTQVVHVTFNPQTAQTYSETMNIFSDDPVNPNVAVSLQGVANEAPVIAITPDSLFFDLLSGEMDSTQFTISNLGSGPLTFELTDEDISKSSKASNVDHSYLRPEFKVKIPKGQKDWRVGTPQTEGAGGPDLFGYKWIDSDEPGGPVFSWIDISGTGTSVSLGDDDFIEVPLPFTFSFYGVDKNSVKICSNGYLTFGPEGSTYNNTQIPDPTEPNDMIGLFWDDLNPSLGGTIHYQTMGNQFVVQYTTIQHYGSTGTYTMEVILNSNGSMLLQYLTMTGELASETIGIEDAAGSDGLQVVFNAVYVHDNLAIKIASESSWLSENPMSGTIPAGGNMDIWAVVNTTGLLGGDYLASVIVASNDPVNPEVHLPIVSMHVTGVPRVSVTPNPLVFDSTFVGATPELELAVENYGTDQLIVSTITSSNPVFTLDTTNLILAPFSSYPVTVTFNPLLPGAYDGIIVFETNDPVTPNDTVEVSAVGVEAPVAVVNPNFVNPVEVNMGDSLEVYINIGNAGGSPLQWNCTVTSSQVSPPMKRPQNNLVSVSKQAEVTPNPATHSGFAIEAPWDLQFSFNLEVASGALGNAGSEFDGTYYYTTRWASNLIHKYDLAGNLVEEFSIPGVTGLRDLAFDGTYMYGGAAANTIYMMDFVTKTLIGTITSPVAVRFIAYDDASDGFWCGNWDTPPTLVSRNGTAMGTITTGLLGQYGAAYDKWSDGGPYLWVWDQGSGAGFPQIVYQYDIASGTATGFTYDIAADFAASAGIAGGLWAGEGVVGGTASIGGCLQGTPDMFFVYELAPAGPTWLKMMAVSGVVGPGDNFDAPARIYGETAGMDTAYVVFYTNDPAAEVINVEVIVDVITGIGDANTLPTTYAVSQNYPNPFNPSTTIKYQLPQTSDVQLQIFNVLGQKVRTLLNSKVEAGYHQAIWDGRNDLGHQVASGIYIYKFQAGNFQKTLKLMLLK